MTEENNIEEEIEDSEEDDLQAYLREMEDLSENFSDLEDLDMEELEEMQAAINRVKENQAENPITDEQPFLSELTEEEAYLEQKESLMADFSDIEGIDLDELRDMQEAIHAVQQERAVEGEEDSSPQMQEISSELEQRLKEELAKKKEEEKEEVITAEKFLEYIKEKRDKIWYHALWHLTFNVDDHTVSKDGLYDVLKEDTSKSPIDPIPYHQFIFGLGYILRLNINNKQVIRYLAGGKFKININVDNLKEMLIIAGPPIVTKPIIEEKEQKQMFSDFLNDDFSDI
ncbi:MAG: hypothetical protein ACTSR8_15120 [Promethearchaeota archaeon]